MKTEMIACPFCGSEKNTPFRNIAHVVTCSSCGTTYLRKRPVQEEIHTVFDPYADETSYLYPPATIEAAKQSGLRRRHLVSEIADLSKKQAGVWLDVGCGWGAMLDEARERGYAPKGIDLLKNCVDYAVMQLNMPVTGTDLLDSAIDPNSCSVVSMVHVLQYLPYPKETIEKAYEITEANGLFCGIVPNINSVCSEYLQDKWPWLDTKHQFVYYSPETLSGVLKDAGFRIEKIYTDTGDYDYNNVLETICKSLPGADTPEKAKEMLPGLIANNKGEEIHFFARKITGSTVAQPAAQKVYSGQRCPCCNSDETEWLRKVHEYDYFKCMNCGSLFLDTKNLAQIDSGLSLVKYEEGYWKMELNSARERSYGPSLARMAEAVYYCKRPIKKFLDIGTGPGYFLDAVAKNLPDHSDVFYGVELFPPDVEYRTRAKNYIVGDISDLTDKFDCGICIEVIEHLTPAILNDLLKKLADVSNPDALYIFNTGMPDYVLQEDIAYLDPVRRGHLVSYSLKAMSLIGGKYGFTAHRIIGKTWAFALEFTGEPLQAPEDIRERIWRTPPENLQILSDSTMGDVLKILGRETSRAYN